MKNYFYCVVILVCSFTTTKAQETVQWPKFKLYKPFQHHVYSQFMSDSGVKHWGCTSFLTSIKFVINENGFVTNVEISEGTPPRIITKLKSIVRDTHGNWEPMRVNGKTVPSKSMVLNIHFSLRAGCNADNEFKDNTTNSLTNIITDDQDTTRDKHFAYIYEDRMVFPSIRIVTQRGYEDINPRKNKQE